MRVLIVGLGSIGRRHLANLRRIEPAADITVWHQHSRPGQSEEGTIEADRVVYRLDDALDAKVDMALVTCPASLHVEVGLALADRGIHLFVGS